MSNNVKNQKNRKAPVAQPPFSQYIGMNANEGGAIPRCMLPRHQFYNSPIKTVRRKSLAPKKLESKSKFVSNVESCSIYEFHKTPERKCEPKLIHVLDYEEQRPDDFYSPEFVPEHMLDIKVSRP